jgi:hypothetical protein
MSTIIVARHDAVGVNHAVVDNLVAVKDFSSLVDFSEVGSSALDLSPARAEKVLPGIATLLPVAGQTSTAVSNGRLLPFDVQVAIKAPSLWSSVHTTGAFFARPIPIF